MTMRHHLEPKLKRLRLSGILETLEERIQQAISGKVSYDDFLERLLEDEIERREQKQLARNGRVDRFLRDAAGRGLFSPYLPGFPAVPQDSDHASVVPGPSQNRACAIYAHGSSSVRLTPI